MRMPFSNVRNVCTENHRCTLLVVDDNDAVLEILKDTFATQDKLILITAGTLRDALRIIAENRQIELVILDLWLENQNPVEAMERIIAANDRMAVIAMSGDHTLEDAASRLGITDFWGKPLLQMDIIGRSKFAIMNQRKLNRMRDRNTQLIAEMAIIRSKVKTDPESAIEELDITTRELKQELQTLMMRAS